MGCLNSNDNFHHWFGNIHLSGNCNRSCYFCIGQHMMTLDPLNNLNTYPLLNLDKFIESCKNHNIKEVNVTGTNTDPLLYQHTQKLHDELLKHIPDLIFGIRTNGVLSEQNKDTLKLYNKGSITICSFDKKIYRNMMGGGSPPDLDKILKHYQHFTELKINIVLGEENLYKKDILNTIKHCSSFGINKINIREPYGQSHIGNPLEYWGFISVDTIYGMPLYIIDGVKVCYWDVHYCEVESINLYANGVISKTYPITKGHDPVNGKVLDQSNFGKGRHYQQWVGWHETNLGWR